MSVMRRRLLLVLLMRRMSAARAMRKSVITAWLLGRRLRPGRRTGVITPGGTASMQMHMHTRCRSGRGRARLNPGRMRSCRRTVRTGTEERVAQLARDVERRKGCAGRGRSDVVVRIGAGETRFERVSFVRAFMRTRTASGESGGIGRAGRVVGHEGEKGRRRRTRRRERNAASSSSSGGLCGCCCCRSAVHRSCGRCRTTTSQKRCQSRLDRRAEQRITSVRRRARGTVQQSRRERSGPERVSPSERRGELASSGGLHQREWREPLRPSGCHARHQARGTGRASATPSSSGSQRAVSRRFLTRAAVVGSERSERLLERVRFLTEETIPVAESATARERI